jgi:hypothetical protein
LQLASSALEDEERRGEERRGENKVDETRRMTDAGNVLKRVQSNTSGNFKFRKGGKPSQKKKKERVGKYFFKVN